MQIADTFLLGAYRKVARLYRMVTSTMTSRDPMTSQSGHHNLQHAISSTVLVGIRPYYDTIFYCIVRPNVHTDLTSSRNLSSTPFISGTCKATNFKFGRYIHRVHPNKSLLKICEKRERVRIQGRPKFFQYPLLSQERVKLRTSNLTDIFTASMRTKGC